MTDHPAHPQQDMDLYGLVSIIFSNKLIISASAIVGLGLAAALAFWMTPVYRAEVIMLPADDESESDALSALSGQFGGLASLAGINLGGDSNKDEALATLASRTFTLDFIRDLELMPVLFKNKWDENTQAWKPEDVSEHPTEWDAYKLFNSRVRFVEEETRTGLIILAIQWPDRELAAAWANELATRVNQELREKAIAEAERSIEHLQKELAKTSVMELEQGIYRLQENNINKIMLANVRQDYAFKIIDPAVVPDPDDFESPKRLLLMALGFLVGGFFGVAFALIRSQRQAR